MDLVLFERALAGPKHERRVWQVVLLAVVAYLALGGAAFVMVGSVYDARFQRDAARAIVTETDVGRREAWNLNDERSWMNIESAMVDSHLIHVFTLWEGGSGGPAIPGLPAWPKAGEVYASPALLDLSGGRDVIEGYGRLVGEVDPGALTDPSDLVLYTGVRADVFHRPGNWDPIESIGLPPGLDGDDGYISGALYQSSRTIFQLSLTVFWLAPALLLTGVALRLGGDERDRAILVLRSLGARRVVIARSLSRLLLPPVGGGVAVATVVLLMASVANWPVPGAGYQMAGSDLRPSLVLALCVIVGIGIAVVMIGIGLHRPGRDEVRDATPGVIEPKVTSWPVWVALVCLVVSNWGTVAFYGTNPQAELMVRLVAAAGLILVLAPMCAPLLRLAASLIQRLAVEFSNASLLVAGRELGAFTRAAARMTAVVGMLFVIGFQTQVMLASGNAVSREAAVAFERNSYRVLQSDNLAGEDLGWVPRFEADHDPSYGVLAVYDDGETIRIAGTCDNLHATFSVCPQETSVVGDLGIKRPELVLYGVGSTAEVSTYRPPGSPARLLYVAHDDLPLKQSTVRKDLSRFTSPLPVVNSVGQSWYAGAATGARQAVWLNPAIALAVLFAVLVGVGSLLIEQLRSRDRLAPFLPLCGRRDHYMLALGSAGAPTFVASVLGLVIGYGMVYAATKGPGATASISPASLAVFAGIAVLATLVSTALTVRILGGADEVRT